jgi:hypothetical protein
MGAKQATEAKLAGARAALKARGVVGDDPLSRRIVAYLHGILTVEQVQLHLPLPPPMGLSVVGFLMISGALARGRKRAVDVPEPTKVEPKHEPAVAPAPPAKREPMRLMVIKSDPPAAFTNAVMNLIEKAARKRVAVDQLHQAYATRTSAPCAIAEFREYLLAICQRFGIQTTFVDDKPYLRGVRLVANMQ